jgi:hypothetical protein
MCPRTVAALLSPTVPILALVALARGGPGESGWREVAAVLREASRPTDLVVVTPDWNLDALRFLEDVPAAPVAGTDARAGLAAGFRRVWVASPPWAAPTPAAPGARERRRADGYALDLFVLEQRGKTRLLDPARAWVEIGTQRTACARDGERLRCGSRDWQWVGPAVVSVHGAPQPCTWAHPIAGAVLAIEISAVPLRGPLTLRTFLADTAAARREGSVDLDLFAGGRHVARLAHPFTERTLSRVVPTSAGIADLRVEIRAADDGRAHFCFDLEP